MAAFQVVPDSRPKNEIFEKQLQFVQIAISKSFSTRQPQSQCVRPPSCRLRGALACSLSSCAIFTARKQRVSIAYVTFDRFLVFFRNCTLKSRMAVPFPPRRASPHFIPGQCNALFRDVPMICPTNTIFAC
jgi:hypothetical protein